MHEILHTDGIILFSSEKGEADKMFQIFTKELGLIQAIAQGVRKNKSKLRYSLQDFSLVRISLVKIRQGFRITNASLIKSYASSLILNNTIHIVARLFILVRRLCVGSEQNGSLFEDLNSILIIFSDENISEEKKSSAECLFALRILFRLGYIGESRAVEMAMSEPDPETFETLQKDRKFFIALINSAIKESHL